LNDLAGFLKEELRADFCDIWQFDAETGAFRIAGVTARELKPGDPPRDVGKGWSHYVRLTKTPVLINDIKDARTFTKRVWTTKDDGWRQPTRAELQSMPPTINDTVVGLDVHDELGLPIRDLTQQGCIGVAWLKYKLPGRVPLTHDAMAALFGFEGQIAPVLLSLEKQQEQQVLAANEAMKNLLTSLHHDAVGEIGRELRFQLEDQLRLADRATASLSVPAAKMRLWHSLLAIQETHTASLRWIAEQLKTRWPMSCSDQSLRDLVCSVKDVADLLWADISPCENLVTPAETIYCDPNWLRLLLFNIVKNAKQHVQDDDRKRLPISISASKFVANHKSQIRVLVDDAAGGFQARDTYSSDPGCKRGFGLLLCKRIVELHGGDWIEPKNNDRGGSVIGFALPNPERK
jgi:K+-sensing histidine kinase KdpD